MSKLIPLPKRQKIIESRKSGDSYAKISRDYKVAYHSVRTLCKRYEMQGEAGLEPKYKNCGPKIKKTEKLIYRCAVWLKRHHRDWGAPLIKLILEKRYPAMTIPTSRTFQNWFRELELNLPRTKLNKTPKEWAKLPHDVWQIDGKEEQQLSNGTPVCWLTIVDEKTCGLIAAPAFQKKEYTVYLSEKYN